MILQRVIYTIRIVFGIFFLFLCFLMSLNSLFSSFSLLHISISSCSFFSFFFFFFKSLFFFSYLPSFCFSFFNALFDFFFLKLIEIINFYWFLFKNTCLDMVIFITLRVFPKCSISICPCRFQAQCEMCS